MVLALQEADMLAPSTPADAPLQGPELPSPWWAAEAKFEAAKAAVEANVKSDPRGLKLQDWLREHG